VPPHLDDRKPKGYAEYSRSKPCIAAKAERARHSAYRRIVCRYRFHGRASRSKVFEVARPAAAGRPPKGGSL
jgi:hypothetical protein